MRPPGCLATYWGWMPSKSRVRPSPSRQEGQRALPLSWMVRRDMRVGNRLSRKRRKEFTTYLCYDPRFHSRSPLFGIRRDVEFPRAFGLWVCAPSAYGSYHGMWQLVHGSPLFRVRLGNDKSPVARGPYTCSRRRCRRCCMDGAVLRQAPAQIAAHSLPLSHSAALDVKWFLCH